ncbi:sulfite exporter TauE/SafE family protein [Salinispirillum sp. LH 10-3-1]|uniref:Probable membrane transporter protein n=1 Tax=Salinispirillum sp. LH 10-3-1 TaxID=2952525 RepID=A0AB38YHP4_9GAMM
MTLWLVLIGAVFVAWTIDAAIGFGSLVIALSLAALVLPLEQAMFILVPLNILLSGYLSLRYRRFIAVDLLLHRLLPAMLVGMLVGVVLHPWLPSTLLQWLFALLIIWFASRSLWLAYQPLAELKPHPVARTYVLTLGAGVTHGLFASGGPLLVYALTGQHLDKRTFRATLSVVWFSLNSLLTGWFLFTGRLSDSFSTVLWLVPVVISAMVFGEWLHSRISEEKFRRAVLIMLLLTGCILMWNNVSRL